MHRGGKHSSYNSNGSLEQNGRGKSRTIKKRGQIHRDTRIVTKDEMARAMILEKVKTDAMFGHGKPRLKVSASAIPSTSKNFDVVKLIRETMEDLSYSHPLLNRKRFSRQSESEREDNFKDNELVDDTTPQTKLSIEESAPGEVECTDIPLIESPIKEKLSRHTKSDKSGKSIILPAMYSHQGYRLVKRDYAHSSSNQLIRIDIKEAGKYSYIRNRAYNGSGKVT